jgi:CPA1 family monovalent cation:H+ antiporter
MTVAGGGPFPHRDLIVFVTFAVILFTLVLQGLTLPLVIRWLGMGDDGVEEHEELRARYEAAHAALARLESLVALGEATPAMADRMAHDYRWQARELGRHLTAGRGGATGVEDAGNGHDAHVGHDHGPHGVPICQTVEALHREVLVAQRRMIVKLRDDGTISDEVLRRILEELDLAESQLHG